MAAFGGDTKIRVRSGPRGAGLFVDGKYVGPAGRFSVPESYAIEAGSHEITLKDPRYEDFTTKVDVKAGKTNKLSAKMKKKEEPKVDINAPTLGETSAKVRFNSDITFRWMHAGK